MSQAALLALLLAGCSSTGEAPTPKPQQQPRYEPVPEDFCDQLPYDEVASRFGQQVPSWFHDRERNSGSYRQANSWWSASCQFSISDEEGDGFFWAGGPGGPIRATVFQDPEDASEELANGEDQLERYWGGKDHTEVEWVTLDDGWWDRGIAVEGREEHYRTSNPDTGKPDFVLIEIVYALVHENLSLVVRLDTTYYPDRVEEGSELMHGLINALIEESMNHLTLAAD